MYFCHLDNCEICTDMGIFQDAKHFSSWAGLSSTINESANKKHSTKISKVGVYIKPLLIQCALWAIANKKNLYYKINMINIKRRRGHKKTIIAIARMILTAIYYMFSTGETFNPYDIDDLDKPKVKKQVLNTSNALE